jgi:DNA repair exonuclease SbcCD ATPase subunit
MIVFKTIRWKNLLSTGNAFTEIKLNETANALIIGENGAGKSTILDALCFALFGKAFRKINKPLLVNSVNGKNCEVQIEFSTNGKEYKIIRGIKPAVFEIYCDDVLLNQDSASKDYQEHLEKFILKMNYKSFTQIVILGSASFVPFMQLSPADRRSVIEDLLDIQIFSTMNVLVKQKMVENKSALERNRLSLTSKEELKTFIERNIASLKKTNSDKIDALISQKDDHENKIHTLKAEIETLEKRSSDLVEQAAEKAKSKDRHKKYIALQTKIETNLSRYKKDIAFYHDHDECPTCRQAIDSGFKSNIVCETETKVKELEDGLGEISKQIDACILSIEEMDKIVLENNKINTEIATKKSLINTSISIVNDLTDEIEQIQNADRILIDNQNDLATVTKEIEELSDEKAKILEDRLFIETALSLLKDGGIKTKIIKQYLPIINKLINKYLARMGFFVNFNINEQFEETIKSRYRDEFSYQNFSEGEKTRIDLALLFTWRSIAKMRNSINTNLLVLDEVLDGSLDNNGTDEFLKIMWDMLGDTNTFVISHKTDTMLDKFEKVYRFQKIKNFSMLQS